MQETVSIMIVGVGGQGTLLASKLLGRVFTAQGLDVKVSEVHGMSQRGGSVVTYVRYGSNVYSPIIDEDGADYILAFEELEALRWAGHLKPGGTLIVNTQQMNPMPVITGAAEYPAGILDTLKKAGAKVVAFDALAQAEAAGSAKAVNVVMVGRLAQFLGIAKECFIDAVEKTVPPKFLELNLNAFERGYAID